MEIDHFHLWPFEDDKFSYAKASALVDFAFLSYCGALTVRKFMRVRNPHNNVIVHKQFEDAIACVIEDITIISFSGLKYKHKKDVMENYSDSNLSESYNGKIHTKFKEKFTQIYPEIKEWLEKNATDRIYFVGHSIGAVFATLAAAEWPKPSIIYNFGSCKVGNKKFVKAFNKKHEAHIFVNAYDPYYYFPRGYKYKHVGKSHLINKGKITTKNWWNTSMSYIKHNIKKEDLFHNHTIEKYRENIKALNEYKQ
jgi:hypothetical protein